MSMGVETIVTPPQAPPAPLHERRKRWTTAEFDRLVSEGFLAEGGPAYLWEGEIFEPMPGKRPHQNAVHNVFILLLARLAAADWTVDQDAPIDLEDGTKPQPDVSVTHGPRSRYRSQAPAVGDVALLVEVSDATYALDAGVRLRKYAAVGVPQYWVVNIEARRVEVYTGATGGDSPSYRDRRDFSTTDRVPLRLAHGGAVAEAEGVAVADILRDSLEPAQEGPGR